ARGIDLTHARVDADERVVDAELAPRALRKRLEGRDADGRHAGRERKPLRDGRRDAQPRERAGPAAERDRVEIAQRDACRRKHVVDERQHEVRLLARRLDEPLEQMIAGEQRDRADRARGLEREQIHSGAASSASDAANASASSSSSTTGMSGRLLRKIRPYERVRSRGSPITTRPRSPKSRISRPTPCFSASTASGSCDSTNGSPPARRIASRRACTSGSPGTANGSLSIATSRSARPGTSTPCQKLPVPSSTASPASRNRSSS